MFPVFLLPFTKKLGKFSYDVAIFHYDVILILFFFTFANVRDFIVGHFLVLTLSRRGAIRIYLPRAKMTPLPGLHEPKIAHA